MRLYFEFHHALCEFAALRRQHLAINENARLFHAEQYWYKRLLDVDVDVTQRFDLAEFRPQSFVQLQRDVGIFSGIGRGCFQVDFIKRQLLCAFACDVLVMNRFAAKVMACNRVHVVTRRNAVQHIRLEHRIIGHALQRDIVSGQHVGIVFEVMADFFLVRVFKKRSKFFKHFAARQLIGRPRVIVRYRNVSGLTCSNR